MKVCVIGTRGFPNIQGGVEKHCEQLYTAITLNHDIKIYLFRRTAYTKKEDSCSIKGIKFIDLPSTKIKGFETVFHSLLATIYCLFLKPDIVHIHNIGPAIFCPILKLINTKIILTYHSANYEHKKWNKFAKSILRLSEKIAFKYSDSIIFVNKFILEKLPENIKRKSHYLPNGITEPKFSYNNDVLEQIGVKPKDYILSVGRITPEKGFNVLIEAYKKSSTHLKLIIVGDIDAENTYAKELKKLSSSPNIIFTGAIYGKGLNQLYQNAAFYVLPSINEGFPLVLLEAMSYNLDLIVSDIPACHIIELDKSNYFPVNNIDILKEKINLKSKGYKLIQYNLSQFDWKEIAENVYIIYKNTISTQNKN